MPSCKPLICLRRSCTDLESLPSPHPLPTTVARCRPEAAALPGYMALIAAAGGRGAVQAAPPAAMAEVVRAEAVPTEEAAEAAAVGVVRTAAAEDRVEEAEVGVALLQVVEVAAAIARVKAGSPSGMGRW